jgi:hypothetical protein
MCDRSHAVSRKHQIIVSFAVIQEFWVINRELTACQHFWQLELEGGFRFLENLWPLVLYDF